MAKDKKAFLVYADMVHMVRKMAKTPEGKMQVADLFITMLEYVNDTNPVVEDPVVDIIFEPIKHQLKRDLKSYEKTVEFKKEMGALGNLKRWHKDLFEKVEDGTMTLQAAIFEADERKAAPNRTVRKTSLSDTPVTPRNTRVANVADTDTDNDTDKDIKIEARKLKFASALQPFLETYGKDMLNAFYKYWTEPNKSKTKFRQEMEKTWDLERRLENWASRDKDFKPNTEKVVLKTPFPKSA